MLRSFAALPKQMGALFWQAKEGGATIISGKYYESG